MYHYLKNRVGNFFVGGFEDKVKNGYFETFYTLAISILIETSKRLHFGMTKMMSNTKLAPKNSEWNLRTKQKRENICT